MNAYPISNRIKNPRVNDLQLLEPVGDPVLKEEDFRLVRELKLQGMGYTRRNERNEQGSLDL
jgi:hypothetical protein